MNFTCKDKAYFLNNKTIVQKTFFNLHFLTFNIKIPVIFCKTLKLKSAKCTL